MYDAFNAGERSSALAVLDPEVVWDFTDAPDGLVYHGHDEVRRFWASLDEDWESLRIDVEAQEEHGDVVICEVRVVGHGRGNKISIEHGETHVWHLHEGKLVEGKIYLDPDRAKAAAAS